MPRQLPWANKGAASRTKSKSVNSSSRPASRINNVDGYLFEETVLAGSKGKGIGNESDDELPNLSTEPSTPRTKSTLKDGDERRHETSSSPPPVADLEQPCVEFMHKAASKFDLRDDEWMMVEDEFLETAKLFTRHLHIAEYDKLKEMIEEKKKDANIARPVVANAKMSATGAMKEKAKAQEQKQKQAIRDVFASQDDDEADDLRTTSSFITQSRPMPSSSASKTGLSSTAKQPPSTRATSDTESEDLDAPRPPTKSVFKATTTTTTAPAKINNSAHKAASPPSTAKVSASPTTTTFAKPAPPSSTAAKPRSRISRATPFDMLDDWVPSKSQRSPLKASPETPVRASPAASRKLSSSASERSPGSFDGGGAKSSLHARSASSFGERKPRLQSPEAGGADGGGVGGRSRSKDIADRLAKRKAEREKSDAQKKKTKTLSVDDIPTFLF